MFEALLDAKHNRRQIVVAWLDLKNAYGSVRHNLIQFALSWFHVPLIVRQLILNYYDKLFVRKNGERRSLCLILGCSKVASSHVSFLTACFSCF